MIAAAIATPLDLDALEASIDQDVPEPKEDDGDLVTVDFDRPLISKYLSAKSRAKDADAEAEEAGGMIRRLAEPLRLSVATQQGALVRSVLLAGQLRYTTQNRFGKVKTSRGEGLARKFNGKFAQSFLDVKEYELDRKALSVTAQDPDVARAFTLLRKAGVLVQTRYYKPTETLFLSYTLDANFRTLCVSEGINPVTMLAAPKSISAFVAGKVFGK